MRRQAPFVLAICASLVLGVGYQPVQAAGLISTERVVRAEPPSVTGEAGMAATAGQRAALQAALVQAGVEPSHAQARLAALTDAEIAQLVDRIDTAPAGGLWFAPFLVVALVIGALIGVRSQRADAASTDLFGRPRDVAAMP